MPFRSQFRDCIPDKKYKDLVSEYFWHQLDAHGDNVLFIEFETGKEYKASDIKRLATKVAKYLTSKEIGLKPGDTCISFYKHSALELICALGTLFAGGSICVGYRQDPEHEHNYMIKSLEPVVIFCDITMQDELMRNKDRSTFKTIVLNDKDEPISEDSFGFYTDICSPQVDRLSDRHLPVEVEPNSPAFILFTSGSTGHPKPVNRSHRNSIYVCHSFNTTKDENPPWYLDRFSVMAGHLPIDHGTGTFSLKLCIARGYKLVIMESYQPLKFLQAIDKYQITDCMLGSALLHNLITMPIKTLMSFDLSSLKNFIAIGSAIPNYQAVRQFTEMNKSVSIRQGFGMTECGFVAVVPRGHEDKKTGVGQILPNLQVKLLDEHTGKEILGFNQQGELYIKGPTVSVGYVGRKYDEQSRQAFNLDGYYRSKDLCVMIEGYSKCQLLSIIGRASDVMCLNDGWKVLPYEIEAIIMSHPLIKEAAVVGIPHPTLPGCHAPRAYCVPRQFDNPPSLRSIFDYVALRLSGPKHLVGGIRLVSSLPRISVGKVDKRSLKKMDHILA